MLAVSMELDTSVQAEILGTLTDLALRTNASSVTEVIIETIRKIMTGEEGLDVMYQLTDHYRGELRPLVHLQTEEGVRAFPYEDVIRGIREMMDSDDDHCLGHTCALWLEAILAEYTDVNNFDSYLEGKENKNYHSRDEILDAVSPTVLDRMFQGILEDESFMDYLGKEEDSVTGWNIKSLVSLHVHKIFSRDHHGSIKSAADYLTPETFGELFQVYCLEHGLFQAVNILFGSEELYPASQWPEHVAVAFDFVSNRQLRQLALLVGAEPAAVAYIVDMMPADMRENFKVFLDEKKLKMLNEYIRTL